MTAKKTATTRYAKTRRRVVTNVGSDSRTVQEPAQRTNIHAIVEKYHRTGELPIRQVVEPIYGNFTSVDSYHDAFNRVIQAEEAFNELHPKIREHFGHDPANLVDCAYNPKRRKEALVLDLVEPQDQEELDWLHEQFSNTRAPRAIDRTSAARDGAQVSDSNDSDDGGKDTPKEGDN